MLCPGLLSLGLLLAAGCDGRPLYLPADWVTLEAGTFHMGSPPEENCRESGEFKETRHQVTLRRGFDIATTEVSQGQFEHRMGYNPTHFLECGTDCPVDGVSWSEAAAYCNALSREDGLPECYGCSGSEGGTQCSELGQHVGQGIYSCGGYRLPTEAEWEYAARAGSDTALPTGPLYECEGWDISATQLAWYVVNSGQRLHLPKRKQPNDWGLYDMSGNVWEWTNDWFVSDLGQQPVTDPAGPAQPTLGRLLRGGSSEVPAHLLRSASRHNYATPAGSYRLRFHGFRCVRPPSH